MAALNEHDRTVGLKERIDRWKVMETLTFKGLKGLQRQKSNFNCNPISYEEIKSTEGHFGLSFT